MSNIPLGGVDFVSSCFVFLLISLGKGDVVNKELKFSFPDLEEEIDKLVEKSKEHDRNYPQISCTIEPKDQEMLNELLVFAINKTGHSVSTSEVIRSLIRLAHKHRDQLMIE